MKTLVLKFGGTSMQTVEIIKHVAKLIKEKKKDYDNIAVVVSAMAKQTDKLSKFIEECKPSNQNSHWNIGNILATGEQISAGLLALCLQNLGAEAISLSSWQIPIETDNQWQNAEITNINTVFLQSLFKKGIIPIITGFQGVSEEAGISDKPVKILNTLGRGGSDTTAVSLACHLNATECIIFTDVAGIFTADPNQIPQAKIIEEIDYSFLEKLSTAGAKVLHPHAAKLASDNQINLSIKSTFTPNSQSTKVIETQTTYTCLVQTEIVGIKGKMKPIPGSIFYQYDQNTQEFMGFFEKTPLVNDVITDIYYFKPYKITVLNPTNKLKSLNLKALLLKEEIEVYHMKIDENITLIVGAKAMNKTLQLLYNAI